MRRERDDRALVENLINFMVAFYSIGELSQMSDKLIAEAAELKVIRESFERALALMVQKKRQAAMDTFRSAYAAFSPNNEVTMREMLYFVPALIAKGASERDLVEILSSDKEKSGTLAPLIVALRLRAGEDVRAPVEVLEVAKDINKDIDAKMAN